MIEREKYLAQYYQNIHSVQVRNLINQAELISEGREDNLQTVQNELTVLGQAARIEPYKPGENQIAYLDKVDAALSTRADNFTALLNKVQQERINEMGSEAFNELKKQHHNLAIEELVLNTSSTRFYKEVRHRIYPKVGTIYLHPDSNWGQAPFYSYEKKWAGYTLSAFTFNLLMLGFFVVIVIMFIFAEFPGRYLNRNNN